MIEYEITINCDNYEEIKNMGFLNYDSPLIRKTSRTLVTSVMS